MFTSLNTIYSPGVASGYDLSVLFVITFLSVFNRPTSILMSNMGGQAVPRSQLRGASCTTSQDWRAMPSS